MIDPNELVEYLDTLQVLPASEQIKVLRVWAEGKRDTLSQRQRTFREVEEGGRDVRPVSH